MSYYENDHWDWCACGRKKKAAFSTCWQCKQEQAERAAQERRVVAASTVALSHQ